MARSVPFITPDSYKAQAMPTPPPVDSQAPKSTVMDSPGSPKIPMTGAHTSPMMSKRPESWRILMMAKAITRFGII